MATSTPQLLKARDRQFRAVNVLPNGQQMSFWLPKGEYTVRFVCWIAGPHYAPERYEARLLVDRQGAKWYVSEAWLIREGFKFAAEGGAE